MVYAFLDVYFLDFTFNRNGAWRPQFTVFFLFFFFLLGNYTCNMLDVKIIKNRIQIIPAFAETQLFLQLVKNKSTCIPWSISICSKEIAFIPRSESKWERFLSTITNYGRKAITSRSSKDMDIRCHKRF